MKLRSDVAPDHWKVWADILTAYNDLASLEYRSLANPADPGNVSKLKEARQLFNLYIQKYTSPAYTRTLEKLDFKNAILNLELISVQCERADDSLTMERYPQAVSAFEQALTTFHEIIITLQPPEEELGE